MCPFHAESAYLKMRSKINMDLSKLLCNKYEYEATGIAATIF